MSISYLLSCRELDQKIDSTLILVQDIMCQLVSFRGAGRQILFNFILHTDQLFTRCQSLC